jgi:hypothetical protein
MRTDVARIRLRHILAAGLGVSCLLMVGGCRGDSSTGSSADAAVHQIKPRTEAKTEPDSAGSSGPDSPGPAAAGEPSPGAALTAENFGAVVSEAQREASTVRVSTELPLPPGPDLVITGDASVGADSTGYSAQIVTSIGDLADIEARVVDSTVYLIDHRLAGVLPSEPPWRQADLSNSDNPDVRDLQQLVQLTDPDKVADFYAGAQAVTPLGDEFTDGVLATCYRVTIGVDTSIAVPETTLDPGLQKEIEEYMPDSYDMKVCLDERLRPVTTNVMPRGIAIHFSDWGAPVEVETPPAARVAP